MALLRARDCLVCVYQTVTGTERGSVSVEVSDTLVVECLQGRKIMLQAGNDNCVVEPFDDARFVALMLQAMP